MDPDLARYLAEDLGAGDITTDAIAGDQRARAVIVAKEACVVCGIAEASAILAHLGVKVEHVVEDGARLSGRAEVLRLHGPASAILTGERLALNMLMRMSGVATLTRRIQDAIDLVNPHCRVAATRKTTPGFRKFEKRAVEVGGGDPHRFGLHDAFLVKDNHLLLDPDVARVVARCRALDPNKFLQVEADTVEQARAAADVGADGVLLDNFAPDAANALARELKARHPRLLVEISGGINVQTAPLYARFADRVSMGALTHSAPAIDFGLDLQSVDDRNTGHL